MFAADAGSVVFTADRKCRHRDGYDGGCIVLAGGMKQPESTSSEYLDIVEVGSEVDKVFYIFVSCIAAIVVRRHAEDWRIKGL